MRWLFEDIGLKLTALTLAFILWAFVGTNQVLERKMDLKAVFTDVPTGAVLTEDVRNTVSVILVGRREKVLDLDPGNLKAQVSLKGLPVPVKDYPVKVVIQDLPKGVALDAAPVLISLKNADDPSKKNLSLFRKH
jgi:hypothetical protein